MRMLSIKKAYQVAVLLLLCGLVWMAFERQPQWAAIWYSSAWEQPWYCAGWLAAVLAFMPFNWYFETLKWQPFVNRYEPMSIGQALKSVLAGVAISLFTPNRMGEFGGRLLFVSPGARWPAFWANAVGSLAHLGVILGVGGWAGIGFAQRFYQLSGWGLYLALLGVLLGTALLYLLYFNIGWAVGWARRLPLPKGWSKHIERLEGISQFSRADLLCMLGWSWARYAVYTTQYYLLLRFFGISVSFSEGFMGIATIFALQTGIPLPLLAGLVARGALATHVWGLYGASELASLAATFSLWIINLIFAALIGTFFLLRVNTEKAFGYEND